ncbi:hypothetical protein EMCRGX_G027132 [Ephydatia muelleri]
MDYDTTVGRIADQIGQMSLSGGGDGSETGLVYDERMTGHNLRGHPENPQRVVHIWDALNRKGYVQRCKVIQSRVATKEDVLLADNEEHYQQMTTIPDLSDDQLHFLASTFDSIYMNTQTFSSAVLAAGSLLEITEQVVQGKLRNGIAVIRPPGHHAEEGLCSGFCIFNNVAITTRAALDRMGVKRVLIVDWDVHHGNGTQHTFWNDKRRDHSWCYFSLYIATTTEHFTQEAPMQIAPVWMGDAEYMAAFHNVLLPVAYEFDPDLVLVSAGFDSAEGDPLGSYHVSPAGYAHMTHALCALANGKVVIALEGGYNLTSISNSMCACAGALLGDAPPRMDSLTPNDAAIECIQSTVSHHSKYWRSLKIGMDLQAQQPSQSNETGASSQDTAAQIPVVAQPQTLPVEPNSSETKLESADHSDSHSKPVGEAHSQDQATPPKPACLQPIDSELQHRRHQVFSSMESAGVEQMFAIEPLRWCKHLIEVKRIPPPGEIDAFQKCEVCSTSQEVWVCLICYKNGCGRHVNQHMAQHHESTSHNVVLSLADMSVWCYACESYVYHSVILPMVRAAQKSNIQTLDKLSVWT